MFPKNLLKGDPTHTVGRIIEPRSVEVMLARLNYRSNCAHAYLIIHLHYFQGFLCEPLDFNENKALE